MKYLVSKVGFPLSINLCTFDEEGKRRSLYIGSYCKSVEVSDEDLKSRELKRLISSGVLVLREKKEEVAPSFPVPAPSA